VRIIDAQLHEPAVSLGWEGAERDLRWPVMLELQLGYLRAVGVDAAVLFPSEFAWGAWAAQRVPETFTVVGMVGAKWAGGLDPARPDLLDELEVMAASPGLVGIRVVRLPAEPLELYDRVFSFAGNAGLPLFLTTAGDFDAPRSVAAAHPELAVVLDQLGLHQPPGKPTDPPFRDLPDLLALAELPNIHLKMTGAPTLSAENYPFADLWTSLRPLIDEFGPHRLMWGSDISRIIGKVGFKQMFDPERIRAYHAYHSYAEALLYVRETDRLSAEEKEWLLHGTAAPVLKMT